MRVDGEATLKIFSAAAENNCLTIESRRGTTLHDVKLRISFTGIRLANTTWDEEHSHERQRGVTSH